MSRLSPDLISGSERAMDVNNTDVQPCYQRMSEDGEDVDRTDFTINLKNFVFSNWGLRAS